MTVAQIPTSALRAELRRRNEERPLTSDAALALALITRAGNCYGLTPAQVLSKRRDACRCHARWAVVATLAHADWRGERIAQVFAWQRGTVIHALLCAGSLVATDATFRGVLMLLRADLAASPPVTFHPITSN